MTKRKTNKFVYVLVACVVAASGILALFNETLSADPKPATAADTSNAANVLETLEVKGRAPKTGYDRTAQFGAAWTDVDRNGCDTRNDILARDLSDVTLSGSCRVMSGTLEDPLTGSTINFVRGQQTSSAVQIDHIVPLSDAWQKGAQQLTQDKRIAFANDPRNLQAVSGRANAQKSDGDAATWLPENKAFRCEYVDRQITVKAAYKLWVTQAEKAAMIRVLDSCS
nr:HNH endonuclease family protein [Leucobacter viscericola]